MMPNDALDPAPPDWYWDQYENDELDDEEYLECALCTHAMNGCGIGEYDYFGPGQHVCTCCAQDEPDANEYQPADASLASPAATTDN
jgi:hypothetical protein